MGSDGTGGALTLRRPVLNEAREDLHPRITRGSYKPVYEVRYGGGRRVPEGVPSFVCPRTAAMIDRV